MEVSHLMSALALAGLGLATLLALIDHKRRQRRLAACLARRWDRHRR